jgi:hypothetical protein
LAWALKYLRGPTVRSAALGADVKITRGSIDKVMSRADDAVLEGPPAIPALIARGQRIGSKRPG